MKHTNHQFLRPRTTYRTRLSLDAGEEAAALQPILTNLAQVVVQATETYVQIVTDVDARRPQSSLTTSAQEHVDAFIDATLTRTGQALLEIVRAEARQASATVTQPFYIIT
jgi:hypothetical protein